MNIFSPELASHTDSLLEQRRKQGLQPLQAVNRENPGKMTEFHKKVQSSILRGKLESFKFLLSGLLYASENVIDAIFEGAVSMPLDMCHTVWTFLCEDQRDFDINECILYPKKESPLMLAALYGRMEMVEMLLASPHINVNVINDKMDSVLTRALSNFNIMSREDNTRAKMLNILLSDDRINVKTTALRQDPHFVYDFLDVGSPELVRMFLSKPEVKRSLLPYNNESNILIHAITGTYLGRYSENIALSLTKAILDFPELIDVNRQTGRTKSTALMYAVQKGNEDIVRFLLQRPEVDQALRDRKGRTAFDIAAQNYPKIAEIFLELQKKWTRQENW